MSGCGCVSMEMRVESYVQPAKMGVGQEEMNYLFLVYNCLTGCNTHKLLS